MSTLQNILAILQIALTTATRLTSGSVQSDLAIAQGLEQIIQAALAAYQQHTGQAIDVSLLQPIEVVSPGTASGK